MITRSRLTTLALLALASAASVLAQTAASPIPVPNMQFLDCRTGACKPLVGGMLFSFTAGTTNPLNTYTDSAGIIANSNPVILDSNGYNQQGSGNSGIWIVNQCYKFVLQDSDGTTIWTQDNVCNQESLLKLTLAGTGGAALIGYEPSGGTVPITVESALNTFLMDSGFSSFTAACSAAVGFNKTLVVSRLWTGTATGTYACDTWFVVLGKVRMSASAVGTFTGNITAPQSQQIFDTTTNSNASVRLPNPKQETWVNWFGPDATGAVNAQPMFTAAITAIKANVAQPYGSTLRVGCGTYNFASTWVVSSFYALKFRGAGNCTKFAWSGGSTTPLMQINDNLESEFSDFIILGSSSNQLLYGIQFQHLASSGAWTASLDKLTNVSVEGVAGYVTTGVYWGGGIDGNNDQSHLTNVSVRNYSHSAFTLNNSQVYTIVFDHCNFSGNGYGQYGVEDLAGSFKYINGGAGAGNYISDFYIASPGGAGGSDISEISGIFESSSAFLFTLQTDSQVGLNIHDTSWSGDSIGNSQAQLLARFSTGTPTAVGGPFLTYRFAGALSINNSKFCISGSVSGSIDCHLVTVNWPQFGGYVSATMKDVFVGGSKNTMALLDPGSGIQTATAVFNYNITSNVLTALNLPTASVAAWSANSTTQSAGVAPVIQMTTSNTSPTAVSTFGTPNTGQELRVFVNDAFTTFTNSATLVTPSGYAGSTRVAQVYLFYGRSGQYWMANPIPYP